MDPAELDARLYALLRGKGCLEPFDDPLILQAQIINILSDLIPAAIRAALLLNREDEPAGPENFRSSMYGKRGAETKRFHVNDEALEFVYAYRESYMSDDGMCAPLMLDSWTIIGVIYLDTRNPGGFEIEEMEILETISGPAAKLIHRSRKQQLDREEMDSYHELLELDAFEDD